MNNLSRREEKVGHDLYGSSKQAFVFIFRNHTQMRIVIIEHSIGSCFVNHFLQKHDDSQISTDLQYIDSWSCALRV
jgi:hypothetical protein